MTPEHLYDQHTRLIDATLARALPRVPHAIDREDLRSVGMIALWKAAQQFDPARGVKFTSMAISFVKGAMYEYLRRQDWVTRGSREAQKLLARAGDALWMRLGRPPTDAETAAYLGYDLDGLYDLREYAQVVAMISMETELRLDAVEEGLSPTMEDRLTDPAPGPEAVAMEAAEAEELWGAVAALPPRWAYIMVRHDGDGVTFHAIAQELEMNQSRANQIAAAARFRLRARFGVPDPEPGTAARPQQRMRRRFRPRTLVEGPRPRRTYTSKISQERFDYILDEFCRRGWDLGAAIWPRGFVTHAVKALGVSASMIRSARGRLREARNG